MSETPEVARDLHDVQVVVVHHKNYPTVLGTVCRLLDQGILARNLVVVDNSQDQSLRAAMERSMPAGVQLAFTVNDGYAAAVNTGVELLAGRGSYTLVATHEIAIAGAGPAGLRAVLERHADAGVAAPVMELDQRPGQVWSYGGRLTPVTRRPVHQRTKPPAKLTGVRPVDWVDGSVAMYRTDVLAQYRMREEFFLYFEETEFHTRLRRAGWAVLVTDDVIGVQSSTGCPAFYKGRNSTLFYKLHASAPSLSVAELVVREGLAALLGKRRRGQLGEFLRGVSEGIRSNGPGGARGTGPGMGPAARRTRPSSGRPR